MYRHLLPSHRKLMAEGATAKAIVVDVDGTKLHMRAHFDDGSTAEFWCHADEHELGGAWPSTGVVFPIRYEPGSATHIDLDLPQIQAAAVAQHEQEATDQLRSAEHRLEVEQRKRAAEAKANAHPDSALTPEVRAELVELKRQYRDNELSYDELEARITELDARLDGQIKRFLEAAEFYESRA